MSWEDNVYYHPEKHGLEIVVEAGKEPNYDFDLFVVWQDAKGNLYYASDSGCSCPSPFEDYTSLGHLTKATSIQEIHDELDDQCHHEEWGDIVVDGCKAWGKTGRILLDNEWDEGEVAEAHYKISKLSLQEELAA